MSSPEKSEFEFGTIFGVLLGISFAALVWTFPLPLYGKQNWIDEYQTIITGIIALIIGAASVFALSRQFRQAEAFRRDEWAREMRAARPTLAFELVQLLRYSENCYSLLRKGYRDLTLDRHGMVQYPKFENEIPLIPQDAFATLKDNLKFGTPTAVAVISNIISKLQIQNSRLHALAANSEGDDKYSLSELHVYSVDSLELIALSVRMFPYSRGEIDDVEIPIRRGHLIQAATGTEQFLSQDPLMLYLIRKYPE